MNKVFALCLTLITLFIYTTASSKDNNYLKLTHIKRVNNTSLELKGFKVVENFSAYLNSVLVLRKQTDPKIEAENITLRITLTKQEQKTVDEIITFCRNIQSKHYWYSDDHKKGSFIHLNIEQLIVIEIQTERVEKVDIP